MLSSPKSILFIEILNKLPASMLGYIISLFTGREVKLHPSTKNFYMLFTGGKLSLYIYICVCEREKLHLEKCNFFFFINIGI